MEDLTDQLDIQHSDEESGGPSSHNKLLGAVAQLYEKKRVKAPTRKEPSLEVSEFHLSQPGKKRNRVKVTDLANVLKNRATHVEISQKLKTAQKRAKTLPKPLENFHADRISRAAGYEHAKRQLNRWDAIVYQQRVAEQVKFPLKSDTIKVHESSTDILKTFRKPTELEIKLSELLKDPDPVAEKKKKDQEEWKKKEKEEDYPLSLTEVIEKRKMLAKLRAQESYRQAKAARHSKIKSKKFHQIQRRARVKEQLREFEELQKKDPEAALKKLEELERTRAEERATLRHRSTGQWAKNLAVRAKYDKEARIALSEQLAKSRELTVKLAHKNESESEKEEGEEENHQTEPVEEDPNNPWVVKRSKEMEDFVSGYRKYWETTGKDTEKNKAVNTAVKVNHLETESVKLPDTNTSFEECILTTSKSNVENEIVLNDTSIPDKRASKKENIPMCYGQNVFTINSSTVKNNDNKLTTNRSLSTFKISSSKKRIKNSDCIEHKNTQKPRPTLSGVGIKSGPWNISQVRKGQKVVSKETQFPKSLNNSFQVTKSQLSVKIPSSISKSGSQSPQTLETNVENAEKPKKNKQNQTLDQLFEDVEEKLQNSVKGRVEKIKEHLSNKRKPQFTSDFQYEAEELPSLEMKKRKTLADLDEELLEKSGENEKEPVEKRNLYKALVTASAKPKSTEDIDPNKFLKVTPRQISSKLPDIMTEGEDALDDEDTAAEQRHLTISEAFAEDDVVDQFQKEKDEEVKKNSVGDVNLTLPGWGNWAGHNLKSVSRRKRKKFVIKFPKVIPRRDTNRGNVIINEDADKPIKAHQVSEIPFPFTSVEEYEASIRAPVGTTWVPQTAHQKLTLPPLVTQMGAVIHPMDENQLVNKKKQEPLLKSNNKKKLKKNVNKIKK